MLLPHAQTLAQARSYVAALADRALTIDASSAYEHVLLELDRVHGDDCPALDTDGPHRRPRHPARRREQRHRGARAATASTPSRSSSSWRCSSTRTIWTSADVRRERRPDAHGAGRAAAPAPGACTASPQTRPAERAEVGQQILRYRRTLVVWCAQAIRVAQPLTFPNMPAEAGRPLPRHERARRGSRASSLAPWSSLAIRQRRRPRPARSSTTPSGNDVVEHWRLAARAAALAEHDTAPDLAVHLTAAQARTIAGDVAAISQALVVLDRRYRNTPDWESLADCDRLGWAALATALDVSLGQPDYSVDQTGWRPRTKPIRGPAKPGVLGVLQAEHNLLVRLKSFPNAMNLRLIVDSQRLLTRQLVPYAERVDPELAEQWRARDRDVLADPARAAQRRRTTRQGRPPPPQRPRTRSAE